MIHGDYYYLAANEVIQSGDECDMCTDGWRDDPEWAEVHPDSVGKRAPDPAFPSSLLIFG